MENWQVSTHAKIPCSGCHVDPGMGGFLSFAGRSIPAFYSQLIYGPKPTNVLRIPNRQACQKCHTSYRQVSPNGDLLIPHRAHVEVLKLNCPVCHKNLVHSVNTQGLQQAGDGDVPQDVPRRQEGHEPVREVPHPEAGP